MQVLRGPQQALLLRPRRAGSSTVAAAPARGGAAPAAATAAALARTRTQQHQRQPQHHRHKYIIITAAAAAAAGGGDAPPTTTSSSSGGGGGAPAATTPKRIILLRHAASEDAGAATRDHERPISQAGRAEAAAIARRLRELGWAPDLIVASNSRRTRMTLDAMAEADDALSGVDAHFLGSLYTVAALDGQTRAHLEEVIRGVACDTANFCVMCVGHNKGWEEAASSFAQRAVRLTTASAALLESAVGRTWHDATAPEGEWRLVSIVTP